MREDQESNQLKKTSSAKAALADPRFGLAWSNPNADEAALLRIAMLKGRFNAILESAAVDGLSFVRENLDHLKQRGALTDEQATKLERMLKSIQKGFEQAQNDQITTT